MIIVMIFIIQQNPLIQEMVNKVSSDSIINTVQRLQNFVTRYAPYDSCFAAANWIHDKFTAYNLDGVYWDTFTFSPPVPANIVGIKRGIVYPDSSYYVMCGHFDATAGMAHRDSARGADDDASGIAAVIEAARILKDYRFEYSIRFIGFSAEEFGIIGSGYYGLHAHQRQDDIKGLYNNDMIGYADIVPESLEVCGDTFCEPLIDHFIACADTYTTLTSVKKLGFSVGDEYNFSIWGYQAIGLIEDMPHNNPYYHSQADTIGAGFNDLSFCAEVIKAGIASIASGSRPLFISENTPVKSLPDAFIAISPDPIRNRVHIDFSKMSSPAFPLSVSIFDPLGRMLATDVIINTPSLNTKDIETKILKLPAGIYYLLIKFDNKIISKKIVLLK